MTTNTVLSTLPSNGIGCITTAQIVPGSAITSASINSAITAAVDDLSVVMLNPNGKIHASALELDGVDIGDTLAKIQERLSILVPDPKRLKKYEALRQAYEHYKTLESLCLEEENGKNR